MPTRGPNQGETRDEWISYCMGDPVMLREYKDENQRYAVCQSYWDRAKKSADASVEIRAMLDGTIVLAKAAFTIDEFVHDLKSVLSKSWKAQSRKGIISALRILEGDAPLTMDELDLVLDDLGKHLGVGFQEAVREPVVEIQEAAYLSGGIEGTKKTGVDFALRTQDKKSLSVLHENTLFWVGEYFGDGLQGDIRGSLRKLFEGGYQRREVMWDLKLALDDILPRSDYYWDLLADHTATKIREIGRVAGYEQAGVRATRIRARIDHKTTQICRRLHGHIIATEDLRGQVDRYLDACKTKDKDKIKASWPWWSDKKASKTLRTVHDINDHIAAGNIGLPPYHARCRTITVAEMILEPGSHDVPEKEQALFEDNVSPIENDVREKPQRKTWEMIPDSQLGSNPGGKVIAPDGTAHYAKFYSNADQARSEFLANDIHRKLGLGAPSSRLETIEWNGENRLAVVTEWMDDLTPVSRLRRKKWSKNDKDQIAKHYLGASLNANWDVVGMEFDNLAKKGRKWYCIDSGGSFAFRARGGAKPFTAQVPELDSLLSPGRHAAEIFNPVLPETIQTNPEKYRKWIATLTDKKIRNSIAASGMDAGLADTIIARRNAIEARLLSLEAEFAPPLQTSQFAGGVRFRDPEHQKMFEDLVSKYQGKDAKALRDLFRQECPNAAGVLDDWRGSTQGLYPSAFKMKAELLESRNLHAYSKRGFTRADIRKDPVLKAADERIPDEEYIRIRAMTQAYYKTHRKKKTVKLHRGTGGSTGAAYRRQVREIVQNNPETWDRMVLQIEQNSVTGWSSNKAVAEGFGRGGITEHTEIPVEDIIAAHETWPKKSYINEQEFLVISDRYKTVQLMEVSF